MSNTTNTIWEENLKELQEENDKKEFFPFMNQRQMAEAMLPDRVGVDEGVRKMMEGGLGNVIKGNPLNDPIYNDPAKTSKPWEM